MKPQQVAASDVRKALEDALERQAAREAGRVAIEVKDGRVSLSGVVHSWREKEAAIGAARGTPGVCEVIDHLSVKPYAA